MNTISITRPTLTEEERTKRMEEIKRATIKLVLETERAKARKERNA